MSVVAPSSAVAAPAASDAIAQAGEQRSARIESLRALAALAVIGCHAWGFSTPVTFATFRSRMMLGLGFLGVGIFFSLTGYLIYLPFAQRDFGGARRVLLGTYARNRALRILPLYYFVLTVVAVADGAALSQWLRFALFGENFRTSVVAAGLDGPMWSLVVELHFYLLLPLLAWGLARLSRGSPPRAAALLLALGLASVLAYEFGPRGAVWVYNLPANFVYFVPGMLLALGRAAGWDRRLAGSRHPLADGDLWIVAALVLWVLPFVFDLPVELRLLPLTVVGSMLMLGAVVLPVPGRLARLFDLRVLAGIGIVSYSLYLWHWPLMHWLPHPPLGGGVSWLRFLAYALPVCLVVSALSYRLIEAPALRLRRRWFASSAAPE